MVYLGLSFGVYHVALWVVRYPARYMDEPAKPLAFQHSVALFDSNL